MLVLEIVGTLPRITGGFEAGPHGGWCDCLRSRAEGPPAHESPEPGTEAVGVTRPPCIQASNHSYPPAYHPVGLGTVDRVSAKVPGLREWFWPSQPFPSAPTRYRPPKHPSGRRNLQPLEDPKDFQASDQNRSHGPWKI